MPLPPLKRNSTAPKRESKEERISRLYSELDELGKRYREEKSLARDLEVQVETKSKTKAVKSRHSEIVRANLNLLSKCEKLDFDLGTNQLQEEVERLTRTCWACGVEMRGLGVRAHVKARSHNGPDEPGNYFILCDACHAEQPDAMSREYQELWLLRRESFMCRCVKVSSEIVKEIVAEYGEDQLTGYMEDTGGMVGVGKLLSKVPKAAWNHLNIRANMRGVLEQDIIRWINSKETIC